MFGIAAQAAGVSAINTLLMNASVYSASAQFASLEFWQAPLPLGTIALTVFLVSTRNILLGMSMAHHFNEHSFSRKLGWMFILNDPGVVSSFAQPKEVDRLGYVTGYGFSLMVSWLVSTALGLSLAGTFAATDLGSLQFAGPMVMLTMMVLFIKGSKSSPIPWIVTGIIALVLFELGVADYLILLLSVLIGALFAFFQTRQSHE